MTRRLRILVTGFGPFPGAPENPTGPLVRALARKPRPASEGVSIKAHVFQTRYTAVDRALPRLLKTFKPDALIMFGLATQSRAIRIETRARNRISAFPDAGGVTRGPGAIDADTQRSLPVKAPTDAMLRALTKAGLPARLSRNAGDYLCNYTLWHGTRAAEDALGPALAAFVHVPPLSARLTPDRLALAGEAIIRAAVGSLRRKRTTGLRA